MPNDDHVMIFKQGARAWNQWRIDHPEIVPDLTGISFKREDLVDIDLFSIDLSGVDLIEAMIVGANLRNAKLDGANLSHASFQDVDLRKATLNGANLSDVTFLNTDLIEADLSYSDLSSARLFKSNLYYAKLIGANLTEAELTRSNFNKATLSGAILKNAKVDWATLVGVDLQHADLRGANLLHSDLSESNLDGANLTEACLSRTQRDEWSIKGVICESIYWDKDAEVKTIYALGEFEKLFADKTRIRLFYKDGISVLEIATLPALIQNLEDSHPSARLRFISIKEDSGGAVVELAVEGEEDYSQEQVKQLKAALEEEAQQRVEYQRQALTEKEKRLELQGEVKQLNSFVDKLIDRRGDTYSISGQAGAVGPNAHAHDMTFNQLVNNVEQSIDLAALATQLAELRQAMAAKQDSSPQAVIAAGEVAKAEIAATEKNTPKVVEHLKAAGQWTLDFAKSVGKDVVVAAIKKAMGME